MNSGAMRGDSAFRSQSSCVAGEPRIQLAPYPEPDVPAKSLRRSSKELRAELSHKSDRIELGLDVHAPDRRLVYRAGGTWDRRRRKYIAAGDDRRALRLVGSQVKAADQLAAWFSAFDADDPDRLSLCIYVDKRRGGKTFFVGVAVATFALKYARTHLGPTICALVVPTFPQQRELHETIEAIFPAAWFLDGRIVYHKTDNYYQLANGAQIWIKSADRPDGLKLGRFSAVGINEAQQLQGRAILNAIGSNIDNGGITFLAMNPPDSVKGLWAEDMHDALQEVDDKGRPVLAFAKETEFPSEKNEMIDQRALTRFAALARVLDPKQAQRDALGVWVSIRDRAYPLYNRSAVRPESAVAGWQDLTAQINGLTGKAAGNIALGAGMDFQRRPWCAFVEGKVYQAPAGVWVPQGSYVYVIRAEICNDINIPGGWWTEDALCAEIKKYLDTNHLTPRHYMLIGDGTGHHQGASGLQRGKDSDPASWSWDIIKRWGWNPRAPIERQKMERRGLYDPATMVTTYGNPHVSERLDLVNRVLGENRLVITQACPQTAESFRKCMVYSDTKKPKGWGAHLTDAVGYLIYVWEKALIDAGAIQVSADKIRRRA